MSARKYTLEAAIEGGSSAILRNQTAWFMDELVSCGPQGLTKADYPGLHVGDLVMRIRRALNDYSVIVTEMEPNTHGWGGEHGRYRLNAQITLKEIPSPKKKQSPDKKKPVTTASGPASNSTVQHDDANEILE